MPLSTRVEAGVYISSSDLCNPHSWARDCGCSSLRQHSGLQESRVENVEGTGEPDFPEPLDSSQALLLLWRLSSLPNPHRYLRLHWELLLCWCFSVCSEEPKDTTLNPCSSLVSKFISLDWICHPHNKYCIEPARCSQPVPILAFAVFSTSLDL